MKSSRTGANLRKERPSGTQNVLINKMSNLPKITLGIVLFACGKRLCTKKRRWAPLMGTATAFAIILNPPL